MNERKKRKKERKKEIHNARTSLCAYIPEAVSRSEDRRRFLADTIRKKRACIACRLCVFEKTKIEAFFFIFD